MNPANTVFLSLCSSQSGLSITVNYLRLVFFSKVPLHRRKVNWEKENMKWMHPVIMRHVSYFSWLGPRTGTILLQRVVQNRNSYWVKVSVCFLCCSWSWTRRDRESQRGPNLYLSALIYKVQDRSELSLSVTDRASDNMGQVKHSPVDGVSGFIRPLQRVFSA